MCLHPFPSTPVTAAGAKHALAAYRRGVPAAAALRLCVLPALALLVRPNLFLSSTRLTHFLSAASYFFGPPASIRRRRHAGITPVLFAACLPCGGLPARRAIAIPHF